MKQSYFRIRILFPLLIFISIQSTFAQQGNSIAADTLKKLSIEELMNLEVTSVSKRAEKLSGAASAVQVITQEDIRRSGATSVPEALRLATNLQVAQVNSSQWAISARGFDNVLANKLLVLINGRTVYTPLYAGVFWDVQNLMLEDIERIEVISGPGGTLWGSNAVNGVINITTKTAKDTQGLYAEVAGGSELRGLASLRYGGGIGERIHYRVYGTGFKKGSTTFPAYHQDVHDSWDMGQGGFRLDWDASDKDDVTLQSNYFNGRPKPDGGSTPQVIATGNNTLGKWNHKISDRSELQLKLYYDQTFRDFRNGFTENLKTYDAELQHRFPIGTHHEVIWGLGYRLLNHNTTNLPLFGFFPGHKDLRLFSAFAQDEIKMLQEHLRLTLGLKLENYTYTGNQYQPNVRLAYSTGNNHTVWAAVSRAIRQPARIDRDFSVSLFPGFVLIGGSGTMKAEEVVAYELGWRLQPQEKIAISISSFYNVYKNIRSAEVTPTIYPITFGNGVEGRTYGAELSILYPLTDYWRLRGGYTFLRKNLVVKPGSTDANQASAESNDPQHQFLIQSMTDLPGRFELGTVVRYVDVLRKPHVGGYWGFDGRISWKMVKSVELSIVAQNFFRQRHIEFIDSSHPARAIERSVYGKIAVRL